jgi:hypothetical protein
LFKHANLDTSIERGAPYFLRIASFDQWSNRTILYQPIGNIYNNFLIYFIRIYTQLSSIGRIKIDNTTISALLYRRIAQSDYYYYESLISNDTHRIVPLDENVRYSVSYTINID